MLLATFHAGAKPVINSLDRYKTSDEALRGAAERISKVLAIMRRSGESIT